MFYVTSIIKSKNDGVHFLLAHPVVTFNSTNNTNNRFTALCPGLPG